MLEYSESILEHAYRSESVIVSKHGDTTLFVYKAERVHLDSLTRVATREIYSRPFLYKGREFFNGLKRKSNIQGGNNDVRYEVCTK